MKPQTHLTTLALCSMTRRPLRHALIFAVLALVCFALSPTTQAQLPRPDGGYPNENTAEGDDALGGGLTIGADNTAIGYRALVSNFGGGGNTAVGADALLSNTTGNYNTADGFLALFYNSTGEANTASGHYALFANTTGVGNTAAGAEALLFNSSGNNNTAEGASSLRYNSRGSFNTANGSNALLHNVDGSGNTAIGFGALMNKKSGTNDIALGYHAGLNLVGNDNNIDIGNEGVAGDGGVMRIGTAGTHNSTFIAGISGVTIASGAAVVINTHGKLGTIVSSERYKEAVAPMDKVSEAILSLNPVTFRYKHDLDPDKTPQFGLVAEEVEKVNPDLVVRDEDGKVNTVRYEAVNAMLLNEFLKEHRKVQELEKQIQALTATVQKVRDQLQPGSRSPQGAPEDL
jgi:hypothetical protein